MFDTNISFDKQFRKIQLEGLLIFWVFHSFIQLYTNVYVIPHTYINQTQKQIQIHKGISRIRHLLRSKEVIKS